MEKWQEHFMKILGGQEEITRRTNTKKTQTTNIEIKEEEVELQVRKLKKKKTPGADNIQNEAWIHGGQIVRQKLTKIINRIWKGEGFPKQWKEGIISPIYKKGDRDKPENYRGVTLLNTAYKIYAMILNQKLNEEIEQENILPDGQAGFRKGRGTTDNIYILNHIIEREISKERGKVYVLFADLTAAFDTVEREELWKCMERRRISKNLIERISETYEETSSRVRVDGKCTQRFWTERGVRQGCPMSPTLFSIYTADLEETLKKGQTGGIVVGKEKVWSLEYADDIALVAKDATEMKEMMRRLEKYLKKKKLTLNTEKTKIVKFRKGGGKSRKENWEWEGKEIEEVKQFKYLGYTFQSNNGEEAHLREITRKATITLPQIWGIGERNFKDDFKIRMLLFDNIAKSMMMYGAEIWGWKEQEKIENVQTKYLRWVLGLDKNTPKYIILEETKRDKLRIETGKRAMKYEEKIRITENKIIQECWKEKLNDKTTKRGQKRRKYLERNGYSTEEVERRRNTGVDIQNRITERDKQNQKQEQYNRIQESTYNPLYKEIKTIEMPKYLKKQGGNGRHKRIARFRCGNEERGRREWLKEEEKQCRICGIKEETIQHLLRHCDGIEAEERDAVTVLGEGGEGEGWMKKVEERRKQVKNTINMK